MDVPEQSECWRDLYMRLAEKEQEIIEQACKVFGLEGRLQKK